MTPRPSNDRLKRERSRIFIMDTSMKNNRSETWFKDLIILAVLLMLIGYAYRKMYTFLSMHKHSIIHELDRNFADQLYSTQRQARIVKNMLEQSDITDARLDQFNQTEHFLNKIEEKYTKNSPGLLFLGPIGTASIVLKEQELRKQLLEVINNLARLLAGLADSNKTFNETTSIDNGLATNQGYINKILNIIN